MNKRIDYARQSLQGLSIGDAFGDAFFGARETVLSLIRERQISRHSKWEFTDDTVMAIAIVDTLQKYNRIEEDALALQFANNYLRDVNRGYGGTAQGILRKISEGEHWEEVANVVFDGRGSMGNGAAMRAGPLGAFFYDDNDLLIKEATRSASITHSNHEAKVGAVAVALACSLALRLKLGKDKMDANAFIKDIYRQLEDSETKSGIWKSLQVPLNYHTDTIISVLGNGTQLLSQDTVPFAIWCAAHYLTNFEEALWKAVSVLGDRDTICAIVGSIVIVHAAEQTVPLEWKEKVEKTGTSPFTIFPL